MYSKNILNFQESTTILNACTKEVWKHIVCTSFLQYNVYTHTPPPTQIYIYIYTYHTTCESTCDTLSSSASNQCDNTVSVAQGGIATPGATKQLLPPDRVLKELYIYIYIYIYIRHINQ